MKNNSNIYIFLFWETARIHEQFLFENLKKQFEIKDVYEIKWNKHNFSNNLRRFYGPGKVGNVEKKTTLCGTDPFLLVIIHDPNPKYEKRRTSKGMELVNINLFENKSLYRKITKAGYAIHSSITEKETNDDLTLLLGKNLEYIKKTLNEKWDGVIKKVSSDVIGQNGWKDLEQLFYVLNSTVEYIVLRNFEDLPNLLNYKHNDIDFLTNDFLRIPYVANGGTSSFNKKFPPFVMIDKQKILLDFGYPQDGYYDEKWAKDILKRRIQFNGFFVPCKEDYFYTLFYHAVFHQNNISNEYKIKLYNLSKELGILEITKETFDDLTQSKNFLEDYMSQKGYLHTNSKKYKIIHNEFFRLVKISLLLWKTQGISFLFEAINGKIKRVILK